MLWPLRQLTYHQYPVENDRPLKQPNWKTPALTRVSWPYWQCFSPQADCEKLHAWKNRWLAATLAMGKWRGKPGVASMACAVEHCSGENPA